MTCDQCEQLRINGIVCHEIGCPNAWRDTTRPCWECGFDFVPEAWIQQVCLDCQADADLLTEGLLP